MQKGRTLYVRIDRQTERKDGTQKDLEEHLAYVRGIAKERYFVGGGFENVAGGMCLFEAGSLEEAREITQNDPLIKNGFFKSELFKWSAFVTSEDMD